MKANTLLSLSFLLFVFVSFTAQAKLVTQEVSYQQGDKSFKGYLAYDDKFQGKRPGVLVVHEWWGHNAYARKRAEMLAAEGYAAFAVDMYGNGKTADHPKQAGEFATAVSSNMPVAKQRFEAAMSLLKNYNVVDDDNLAAIGYCFGGGIVLNMARLGVDLDGVVSFHGSLKTSDPAEKGDITARIRVFNGADDPFVKAEDIEAFKKEMDQAGVDYEFVNLAGAKHSFTNPDADKFGEKFDLPLEYNAEADKKSWQQTLSFFEKIFSD